MKDSVTWKIGGEAGFGIMSSGIMLARALAREGYHVFATNEYPSLIRGGHNLITVRISSVEFFALHKDVHILVALNKETVDLHKEDLSDGTVIVFDPKDHVWTQSDFTKKVVLLSLPMKDLIAEHKVDPVMRNTIALGATMAILGTPLDFLSRVIADQFKKKGEEVISQNITIAKSGYDAVKQTGIDFGQTTLAPGGQSGRKLIINGSEAVGLGAVRAGLKFAAIYPMTPINSLISFLADHAKKLNLVYRQPEDEIAGINMAIGASVSGVRSMVATSGGGFALMEEGVSLAGMVEVPLVIDMGMRVGPATGMPTYTEQGELLFIIHAGHGEFPKIVLAPADAKEAYEMTIEAFNLADRYQIPVFILTDKYLNENQWCVPEAAVNGPVVIDRGKLVTQEQLPKDGSYLRYDLSVKDGVSPRSVPGMQFGHYWANSYEHDQTGHMAESSGARTAMAQKRLSKFDAMSKDMRAPSVYGDIDAEISIVAWGSMKGPILEALTDVHFMIAGKKANVIHYSWLYPFPAEATKKLLAGKSRIIDIEQNATGQLASLIQTHTGITIAEKLLKFDGRQWYPEEILEKI